MLIRKDKQALIFKLKKPSKITTVIPTAKIVQHKGYPLVAVPHRPDETRVLRNLGFEVPDPLPFYYDWPGQFRPFKAQEATASFLSMHDRAYCLNSMGLGKTVTSVWAYDFMKRSKQVDKVLVVCPLSTMEDTWAKAFFNTLPTRSVNVLYGSKERRIKLLAQDADVYIINTHGLKAIKAELAKRPDINLVIIDELAVYRNSGTELWKDMNTVINKQTHRKVWGLTGAPIPHDPTDAWAQCKLVTPNSLTLPKYFSEFRNQVMRQVTQYKWVPRDNALDVVYSIMQPAIRFALDDCVDLPPQTFITREVEQTPEQAKAYKQMLRHLQADMANGSISAVNEAVKASKLLQIVLGVAYAGGDKTIKIPTKPRLDVLREVIEESERKVLVFVPLTGALEHVVEELRKDYTVGVIHGGTPKAERDEIFHNFQNTKDPHILVANPRTMSHGLTLTAATTIVWYGPTFSNDTYVQACARVRRPGQTRTTVIVHITSSDFERKIFERLQSKQKMQNVLLDMLKEVETD